METIKPGESKRFAPLDGIRGVAILLVLFYHLGSWSMNRAEISFDSFGLFGKLVLFSSSFGWLGVDLFFVLSGFLITGILLKKKERKDYFVNFYHRRIMRILPLYFLVLLLILMFYENSGHFVLISSLFMANMAPLFGVEMTYVVLWSLAVEEHFYLIWPLLVKFLNFRKIVVLLLLVCCVEPWIRYAGFVNHTNIYYYSWFRFDGLAMGGLLACLVDSYGSKHKVIERVSCACLVLGLMLFAAGAPYGIFRLREPLGASLCFSAVQLVFLGLIANTLTDRSILNKVLENRILVFTGKTSYCIYLVHLFFIDLFDAFLAKNVFLAYLPNEAAYLLFKAVFVLALSYCFSSLSYTYFEGPLLRHSEDRFSYQNLRSKFFGLPAES